MMIGEHTDHLNAEFACDYVPHAHVTALVHDHHLLLERSSTLSTYLIRMHHTAIDSST